MNGTPSTISPDIATLAAKVTEFWSNVTVGKSDECWPWTGYLEKDGYGQFYFEGRMRPAHELAVTFTTGERRAPGLDTCHSCNNPPCCNPADLRFDTRKGNVADMLAAGTHYAHVGKLDRDAVQLIRERYSAGAKQATLAADYGVTNGLISQIVRGLRWVDAPGPITTKREKYNHG
jgi:hypothetical protein